MDDQPKLLVGCWGCGATAEPDDIWIPAHICPRCEAASDEAYLAACDRHLEAPMVGDLDDFEIPYQDRVGVWMLACFGAEIAEDMVERCHRFFEEAGELVQALGMTEEDAHALVRYTWGRPKGDPRQEVGGVAVTLGALCNPAGISVYEAAESELARIWLKVEQIRAKQAAKPHGSPLPVAAPVEGA